MPFPGWQSLQEFQVNIKTRDNAESSAYLDADAALLMQAGQGDESAFTELIEKWKNPLINFFYRSLNSYAAAEDLSQVTFIKLYRAAPKYEPRAKFSTFLFHIARRLLINEIRRQNRKPLDAVDPQELNPGVDDDSTLRIQEIEEAFSQAIRELPENQATAILLLKQQELSYEEIAEIMDASLSAVKTWIFRARQHLRQALDNLT